MSFDANLERYADLILCHGVNLQEGQLLNITAEACHRDFCALIADTAYRRGAKYVDVHLTDSRFVRSRVLHANETHLKFVPPYLTRKFDDLVEDTAASLRIVGSENPDVLSDLDPRKVNQLRQRSYLAMKRFYEVGIHRSQVHWNVAAAATPLWGQKVFPELGPEEACMSLWQQIFRICRVEADDALERWKRHDKALRERAAQLTQLQIRELHFTGPGTDLMVGLAREALFKGGGDVSPRGVDFEPNIPTEEVFTTPDYRKTQGEVRSTRPFLINGKLIQGLQLEFQEGKISSFKAEQGEETFREYIGSDAGACRLGEVALVGTDSPVYQSGLVFQEILYDENAACHIAVGSAYKIALRNGEAMTPQQLAAVGCNESTVHTDMMISSEEVNVTARPYAGEEIPLIRLGEWVL